MTSGFFLYVICFNPGQSFQYYSLLQHSPTATQNAKASLGLHDYPAAFAQLNAIKHRIEVDGRSRDEVVAKPVEQMANHASTRTTQLYDRRTEEVTLDE